jgi:cation transport regulator ChaC
MSDASRTARTVRQQLFADYDAERVVGHEAGDVLTDEQVAGLAYRLVEAVEEEVAATLREASEGEL